MKARLCLWLLCLAAPLTLAGAEPIHLVYFRMAPLADEIDGKASGPAVTLVEELTEGLGVTGAPTLMPMRRLEYALRNERTIAIGLGRTPRREALGLVWVAEIFQDDYYFVTTAGHPAVTGFDDARKLGRVACNLGSAPADVLLSNGFANLENAVDMRSEAAKLHAGHVDGWFDLKVFIDYTWRGLGYDPAELQWSKPIQSQPVWIAASPLIETSVIDTIRKRFEVAKSQGRLDPLLAKLVQ